MQEHRHNNRYSELEHALVPLAFSERSPLAFYRALCQRFDVSSSSDGYVHTDSPATSAPIRVYLVWNGERRVMSWTDAVAAMDHEHLRFVVHESSPLLASFASQWPEKDEEALEATLFDAAPEPVVGGRQPTRLPRNLLQAASYRTVWTLTSPLAHGADQKSGNVTMFRRERSINPLTGEPCLIPFVAGNAVRGVWRRMAIQRWLTLLGLTAVELHPLTAHSLLSGGNKEKGSDSGPSDATIRAKLRRICPPWDLLGGVWRGKEIMRGILQVHSSELICRENAWMGHQWVRSEAPVEEYAASLPVAAELTLLRLATRQVERDLRETDGQQMIYNQEMVIRGCQMLSSFQVRPYLQPTSDVSLSCLTDLLEDFMSHGQIAARGRDGCGLFAADPYEPGPGAAKLPPPDAYLEFVESTRQEAVELLMGAADSEAAVDAAVSKTKPKRGKSVASAAGEMF